MRTDFSDLTDEELEEAFHRYTADVQNAIAGIDQDRYEGLSPFPNGFRILGRANDNLMAVRQEMQHRLDQIDWSP